jgi:hypothetical protein
MVRGLFHDLRRFLGESFTIVLTLNIPEDEAFIEEFRDLPVTVIRNSAPRGFGANHNAAFERCAAQWFVVLNPDLRLPENPFPPLRRFAAQVPALGAIAPRVFNSAGQLEDAVRSNLTPWSIAKRSLGRRESVDAVAPPGEPRFFWLAGMFLFFRSVAYRHVAGFDERFFLYCEDYDICARLHLAGYKLVVAHDAWVLHDARRTSRRSFTHLRWHVASLMRVWISRPFWQVLWARHAVFRQPSH